VKRLTASLIQASLVLLALLLFLGATEPLYDPGNPHQGTLYVTLDAKDGGLQLTTRFENEQPIAGPRADKVATRRFRRMYQILEHRLPNSDELDTINRGLSDVLIVPIQATIDRYTELVVVLQGVSLETPFDLLSYRGRPLFLQRSISYRIGPTRNAAVVLDKRWSAFVVSDVSADPERACRSVTDVLEAVEYRDVHEVTVASLRREAPRDILVLSVHGVVGNNNEDHLKLGKETVLPSDFESLRPRLVYFDSCRLGVSHAFLNRFRDLGTRYYIAPILSNEAGESSTHTLRMFFEQMGRGETPEAAMFITRKNLAERYKRDNDVTRWWRAFPFRVYRLN
jgi:hypothetical protein